MGQSFVRVKDGRKASFKVDHAILAQVLSLFVGDAFEGFLRLHHGDSVAEALKIFGETSLIRAAMKPLRQCMGIGSRKFRIAHIFGQINHSLRAQHTIQVLVQEVFGLSAKYLSIWFHRMFFPENTYLRMPAVTLPRCPRSTPRDFGGCIHPTRRHTRKNRDQRLVSPATAASRCRLETCDSLRRSERPIQTGEPVRCNTSMEQAL